MLPSLIGALGHGPRSSPPPDPTPFPGYVGWWKGSSLEYDEGDPVGGWANSVPMGLSLGATGSQRPTYAAALLNGKPGAVFDGTVTQMGTNSSGDTAGPERTIFIVVADMASPTAIDSDSLLHFLSGGGIGQAILYTQTRSGQAYVGLYSYVDGTNPEVPFTAGEDLLISFRLDGANSFLRLNGDPGREVTFTWPADATAWPGLEVGHTVGGSNYMGCGLLEIVYYNLSLADADAAYTDSYLKTEYGL